ncbi:hypothetical protein [Spiroplasma endosymbiont of Panorpa germanica]|uniref:hypothetical protein n=1 Tax=Spiroplasma endosymbiont of Panorpa germanica TaxID=3066314 RepID=UPI0030CD5767
MFQFEKNLLPMKPDKIKEVKSARKNKTLLNILFLVNMRIKPINPKIKPRTICGMKYLPNAQINNCSSFVAPKLTKGEIKTIVKTAITKIIGLNIFKAFM